MTAVIADARRFADMHALYRLFDERGRLLYVGITGDLGQRLGEHSAKRWFPLVTSATFEWKDTRAAAQLAERRAIATERPRYNRAGLKPPVLPIRAEAVKVAPEPEPAPPPPPRPRNLMADLDHLLGTDRIRLSALPHLLRQLAPEWEPYQRLTGVQLRAILADRGIRTIKAQNVPRLDPADFRKVYRKAAA